MDFLAVHHTDSEIPVTSLDDTRWQKAAPISIEKYWSGSNAPISRHTSTRILWSDTALYVRFEAAQAEPLIISDLPDVSRKTLGLWDRDVCEIFIAPEKANPNKYFEFEIAPTGEWVDLSIEITPEGRKTDFEYKSAMTSAAWIGKGSVVMAVRIPFTALGKTPKAGEAWLGNLFRCVGKGSDRGYLTWRPTRTEIPNFHVPEAFGEFRFQF